MKDIQQYAEELATGRDLDAIDPERTIGKVAPVLAVLVLSAFVMILNETVLSVALPHLMRDLAITATDAQWLSTGFMLTMAVVIPTTGFLLQRFRTRTLFAAALIFFLVGSLVATIAPSFGLVLLGRIVQAGGTAIILPLLMATTLTSVPERYRGTVMGLNAVVISVGPAIGPTLSGLVVDSLGWRWVFGLMLPIAAVTLIFGLVLIRTQGITRKVPLDALSVILSALAFGGLVYALASIGTVLNGQLLPLLALFVGVAALALFVVRQVRLQRSDQALLDLRPFGVPVFRVSVTIVAIAMAVMLGTVMVLPIHLQNGLGIATMVVGLMMLPGGLLQGLLAPVIGRLYDAVGPRPLVIPGAILLAGGQWWLSTLTATTPIATVIAMHVIFCLGMALLMTPLMTASLGALPPHQYGHGSAIMNTIQQLAGAAGIAVMIAAMTIGASGPAASSQSMVAAQVSGTTAAFVVGGVLALVAVVCAPFVGSSRAAEQSEAAPVTAEAADGLVTSA